MNPYIPYDEWPSRVQLAFERYADAKRPSIAQLAAEGVAGKRALEGMAKKYSWTDELARRDRAAAEQVKKKQDSARLEALENIDKGVSNGASAFALMASGICPMCRGVGKAVQPADKKQVPCKKCGGDGLFDVAKLPAKSFSILITRLEEVWGYARTNSEGSDTDSGITPQQQKELAQEMLRKAGVGVVDLD